MLTRYLGLADYAQTLQAMQDFTANRTCDTEDELWVCQHPPVYTQGITGKPENVIHTDANIPIVATNRGGQITYHGPGQVVAYPLIDLRKAGYLVKEYVFKLEEAVIRTLAHFGVAGQRVAGAPGIYIRLDTAGLTSRMPRHAEAAPEAMAQPLQPRFDGLAKIGALGIKISNHCTYHGLALNVAMNLEPYNSINPCGYANLKTVDLTTIGVHIGWQQAAETLARQLNVQLGRATD